MKTITQAEPPDTEKLFQVRGMNLGTIRRLQAAAKARGLRTSDVLSEAIEEYLERHPIDAHMRQRRAS